MKSRCRISRLWIMMVLTAAVGLFANSDTVYFEQFSGTASLADRGFTEIDYWVLDSNAGVMKTTSPGGWDHLSEIATPLLSSNVNRADGDVIVRWRLRLPTSNTGGSWRELNKVWTSIKGAADGTGYKLMFKPNRAQDRYTSFDLELKKLTSEGSDLLAQGLTHTLTPSGPNASFVSFRMVLKTNGEISVNYDIGNGFVEYINVTDSSYSQFTSLHYTYRTDTGSKNYYVEIDDIFIEGETPEQQTSLQIIVPSSDTSVAETPVSVTWTFNGDTLNSDIALNEGNNSIIIDTLWNGTDYSDTIQVTLDTTPPTVEITSPVDGSYTNTTPVTVSWTVDEVVQSEQLYANKLG